MIYLLGMNFTIKDLQYSSLDASEREMLIEAYVKTLARELDVHEKDVTDMPEGTPKSALLMKSGIKSTILLAWAPNRPPKSSETSVMEAIIASPAMALALETATSQVVHLGNEAILGHVEVKANAVKVEAHAAPAPEPGLWLRWWPFFLLLLLIGGAIFAFGGCLCGSAQDKDYDAGSAYSDDERAGFMGFGRRPGFRKGNRRGEFTV